MIMEGRRRQNWDNKRSSWNRRLPSLTASWHPTVPAWEKDFCRVVGSMDWETLLQKKVVAPLYEDVIKWDDSAGKDVFSSAKKRFWAKLNGLPCEEPLPDPDLYIDKIDWDSPDDPELMPDFEKEHSTSNADKNHEPVILFGDALLPKQSYSSAGWGDDEDNFKVPANSSSPNHPCPWEQNCGHNRGGWNHGYGWNYTNNNVGGWNHGYGWNYTNNNGFHNVGHHVAWFNDRRNTSSRVQGNDYYRNSPSRNGARRFHRARATYPGHQSSLDKRCDSREWNSFNSYGPDSHHSAITVGQTWNWYKVRSSLNSNQSGVV